LIRDLLKKICFFVFYAAKKKELTFLIRKKLNPNINFIKLSNKKILMISPHSDDETIGCGALINVISKNNYLKFLLLTNEKNQKKSSIRQKEYLNAVNTLARKSVKPDMLGLPDGELYLNKDKLNSKVSSIVTRNKIEILFVTSVFDFHPDHRAAAFAALDLLKVGKVNEVFMYFTNHPVNFSLVNYFIHFNDGLFLLKKQALSNFKSQNNLNFKGLIDISKLQSKALGFQDGGVELFIKIDRNSVDKFLTSLEYLKPQFSVYDYKKSVIHPFYGIKNILFWDVK
jgi:hypothetical protein